MLHNVHTRGGHQQVLKTENLVFTVLVVLVLSTTFTFLNPTIAQTSDAQKQKAQTLLTILSNNNLTITQAFSRLDSQNIPADDAKTVYNQGVAHALQSESLVNEEKFVEACKEAVVTMQIFEETLQLIENASPVEPTEAEVFAEQTISLKANITRAVEQANRLENLTQKAANAGYDTMVAEKRLREIGVHLQNALQEFRNSDLEASTEQLLIAKSFLEEFNDYINRLTANVTASNTEAYLNEAATRITEAKQNITLSASLTAASKEAAIAALNNSEVNLANARNKIAENNVDEAIEELEEAKKWEEESTRAITADSANAGSVAPTTESVNSTNESNTTNSRDTVTDSTESVTRADVTATK
jgi:hypothetical protein